MIPARAKRIAVIGGGAKAAAIAARADVMNRVMGCRMEVTIFEEFEIGANWSGVGGYTDGEAQLCTPAERDLGFPYDPGVRREVAQTLFAEYSWQSYLIGTSSGDGSALKDWVNRGRRPETHAEFARYLVWAVDKSGADKRIGPVSRLQPLKGGWWVHRSDASGPVKVGPFDGVVITGPGPAPKGIPRVGTTALDRIVDGRSFWNDANGFLDKARGLEEPVVIIGAGGTSAAIAARAVAHRSVGSVVIIGDQAALFSRTESFFESQLFSDDALWRRLAPQTRRDFVDRLNRGVVWATISDTLAQSNKLRFVPGRGQRIESIRRTMRDGTTVDEIAVHFEKATSSASRMPEIPAGLVVDASGFNAWWFMDLLPQAYRAKVAGKTAKAVRARRGALSDKMGEDLALFDRSPGPIHAPMLSQTVGPGFASLMVLGSMSERILSRYTS